jgi:predicted dehydrogenase
MAEVYSLLIEQNPLANLVAIVGNTKNKTNNLATKNNCQAYFEGDLESALKENKNVDAVIIASSEWIRKKPFEIAIRYKKHILYEKPMASSLVEAKEIFKLLNENQNTNIFLPVFNLRFSIQYNNAKNQILNDNIGDIRHIISKRNGNQSIAKRIVSNISPFYWLSPHEIDLIRWYTVSEVDYVETYHKTFNVDEDGYIIANIIMKNGVIIQHTVSWCSPEVSDFFPSSSMEIYGNKGIISIQEENPSATIFKKKLEVMKVDTSYLPTVNSLLLGPFKLTLDYFLESINSKKIKHLNNNDAFEVMKVCEAMSLSSKTNKRIYLVDL